MGDDVEMSGTSLERKARTQWDARVILCLSNIEEDGTLTVGAGVNVTTPCVKIDTRTYENDCARDKNF